MQKLSFFSGFTEQEQEHILVSLQAYKKTYASMQVLLHSGDPIQAFGILAKGKLCVQRVRYDGEVRIQSFLEPKDIFAESFVFAKQPYALVDVIAMKESEVWWISPEAFYRLGEQEPALFLRMNQNVLQMLAQKNVFLSNKNNIVTQDRLESKVLEYLRLEQEQKHQQPVIVPFTRTQLANYLHCNRTALSRVLSTLESQQRIRIEGKKIWILKPELV